MGTAQDTVNIHLKNVDGKLWREFRKRAIDLKTSTPELFNMILEDGLAEDLVECEICGQKFMSEYALNKHTAVYGGADHIPDNIN